MTREPFLTWSQRIYVLLVVLAFGGVAWFMFGLLASKAEHDADAAGWKVVPGRIEQVKIEAFEHPGGKRYREAIGAYAYTWEGKPYRSTRIYFDVEFSRAARDTNSFHGSIENAASSGKPVDVLVNPLKPSESALFVSKPGSSGGARVVGILCGIAALVLAIGLLYEIATSSGRARKPAGS